MNWYDFLLLLNGVQLISAQAWGSEYKGLYYKLITPTNDVTVDTSIVIGERSGVSMASCSLWCLKKIVSVSFYYQHADGNCYCNNAVDPRIDVENGLFVESSNFVYGYINTSVEVTTNGAQRKIDVQPYEESCYDLHQLGYRNDAIYSVQNTYGEVNDTVCKMVKEPITEAKDCLQWYENGYLEDGVYQLRLSNGVYIDAWCDQTDGGWTVFQHREDGSVDFYRGWSDYVDGFGQIDGEYWLGLEAIHLLVQQTSTLRIEMGTLGDVTPPSEQADYGSFYITNSSDKYRLSYLTYSGRFCTGDTLANHKNHMFTTYDNDNDVRSGVNCAARYHGAWWFHNCHQSNLNGFYEPGRYTEFPGYISQFFATRMIWYYCWEEKYSVATTTMKVRRQNP